MYGFFRMKFLPVRFNAETNTFVVMIIKEFITVNQKSLSLSVLD